MNYKVLQLEESKGKLLIPADFNQSHVLVDMRVIPLTAGLRTETIEVGMDPRLSDDEIMISGDVLESLLIPADLRYQVKFTGEGIKIGPVIGLLMAASSRRLKPGLLHELLKYTVIYPEVNGLLVAFSAEGIDFENMCVEGYYYSPYNKRSKAHWKKGVFPIPDSIFQRTDMPDRIRLRLKEVTGNKMFNSCFFDKWDFWNIVNKFDPSPAYLPDTRLLSSIGDIDKILETNGSAYLKPINSTLSRGIYKVTKADGVYGVQNGLGQEVARTSSKEETANFIKSITKNHRYLVQQALSPLSIENRHLDFRVIMQKDQTMDWICPKIYAFIGRRGSICSNWGFQSTFEDIFADKFNFSQAQIFKKRQEVIEICKKICRMMDSTDENYGDLGFDVLIDKSFKVWVLEANKRHYHVVSLWINDIQTFLQVKSNPIKYATALAGFDVY